MISSLRDKIRSNFDEDTNLYVLSSLKMLTKRNKRLFLKVHSGIIILKQPLQINW